MTPARSTIALQDPWKSFLKEVDSLLSEEVTLHCLGGFVLAVLYNLPRPTADVDYVNISPFPAQEHLLAIAGLGSRLAKKHKLYLQRASIADLPYNYEDRLLELELGLDHLRIFTLEIYDLVLSKICSPRPKDFEDAKYLITTQSLLYNTLYARWQSDLQSFIPHPERHETTLRLVKDYFPL
jgi:hypothetical protein